MASKNIHKLHRVVVTGLGGISSLGENTGEIWNSIASYKVGYKIHNFDDESICAKYFALIDKDRKRFQGFPKSLLKSLPEFSKYALLSAREALQSALQTTDVTADLLDQFYSPYDRGVIIGTGWGGLDAAYGNHSDYCQQGLMTSFATVNSMLNVATAATSIHWRCKGYQGTPVAACASGSIAIGDAFEIIRSGRAKMMLAGGSESLKCQTNVWGIDSIQALSKEQSDTRKACCPFSLSRSGFVLAEGAAVLCLEDRDSAIARGANIIAEITGYGNFSDADDMTAPSSNLQSKVHAINRALMQAQLLPADIDYINAHGTSTPLNDINETLAIKEAFGSAAEDIPISSTKSYTGHLIGAAGAMEAILSIKALNNGLLPATIHLDEPDPKCDLNYLPNEHANGENASVALSLNFGFGGANSALVLQKMIN